MTVRAWTVHILSVAAITVALLGTPGTSRAAPGDTLMDYGADVVTNYVFRGIDLYQSAFDASGEAHGAFNVSPALQPSVTFYGPSGLSFGLWGNFALVNRAEADGDLKALDEIDYTLSYAWENPLGSFSAGYVNYSNPLLDAGLDEVFFTWGLPVAASLGPTLSHYVDVHSAAMYTSLAIGGGDAVTWGVSVGQAKKLQDITFNVGYGFGDLSVAFNAAYRPNLDLVGPYDTDGKYIAADGSESTAPSTVAWISLSYGGSVKE